MILAGNTVEGVYLDDLCFEAQQAAEKSIKAVFIVHDIRFPFSHDIGKLLDLLAKGGAKVPKYVREAEVLTDFATFGRYPGSETMATRRTGQARGPHRRKSPPLGRTPRRREEARSRIPPRPRPEHSSPLRPSGPA